MMKETEPLMPADFIHDIPLSDETKRPLSVPANKVGGYPKICVTEKNDQASKKAKEPDNGSGKQYKRDSDEEAAKPTWIT
jgi:hypothetical protein